MQGLPDPPPPSPEQRDQTNRLDIHYHLSAPATLSSRIVAPESTQWVIHTNAARPTPGAYIPQSDGPGAGPGPTERRGGPGGTGWCCVRAYPGEPFLKRKRLHEVVVGARFESTHAIAGRVQRGEHQDARAVVLVA